MPESNYHCSDCDVPLIWIQVYDVQDTSAGVERIKHGLEYGPVGAPRDWLGFEKRHTVGTLQAAKCPSCHKVAWYAISYEEWQRIERSGKVLWEQREKRRKELRGQISVTNVSAEVGGISFSQGEAGGVSLGGSLEYGEINCLSCGHVIGPEEDSCAACGWSYSPPTSD